ncbi:unnamed protein product [Owenia fusiformis]|uniref:Coiled-coil domain-containing protein n=1 Tax=Owenia fusiformis TaxID=6347 RepID=A0A8J1UDP5_OWEFU|nr:unnamed protein product [Owenia fusiformis]
MASVRPREGQEEQLPEPGRVKSVRRDLLVHIDHGMAHKLQQEEYNQHCGLNRQHNRTIREDIPVAKVVQTEEEKRLQMERMRQLESLRRQERNDEIVAKQIHARLQLERQEQQRRALEDEDVARHVMTDMVLSEQERVRKAHEDEIVARQVMAELMLEEQQKSDSTETEDQKIAMELQQKEKAKYERHLQRRRERELAKERQRLERELEQTAAQLSPGIGAAGTRERISPERALRNDGKIEDRGDFSDFYVQPSTEMTEEEQHELQRHQDEELARLLQEQEHKRGASATKDTQKVIEQQDAELARIIQEQEKLKARKIREKYKQRQMSLQQKQEQTTEGPERSRSLHDRPRPRGHDLVAQEVIEASGERHSNSSLERPSHGSIERSERPSFGSNERRHRSDRNTNNSVDQDSPRRFQAEPLSSPSHSSNGTQLYRREESHSPEVTTGASSGPFNIAEVIDPTFRRNKNPDTRVPYVESSEPEPLEVQTWDHHPVSSNQSNEVNDPPHITSYDDTPEEERPDSPVLMPVAGQRRTPPDKSKRNSGSGKKTPGNSKRSSCKQQ